MIISTILHADCELAIIESECDDVDHRGEVLREIVDLVESGWYTLAMLRVEQRITMDE